MLFIAYMLGLEILRPEHQKWGTLLKSLDLLNFKVESI